MESKNKKHNSLYEAAYREGNTANTHDNSKHIIPVVNCCGEATAKSETLCGKMWNTIIIKDDVIHIMGDEYCTKRMKTLDSALVNIWENSRIILRCMQINTCSRRLAEKHVNYIDAEYADNTAYKTASDNDGIRKNYLNK